MNRIPRKLERLAGGMRAKLDGPKLATLAYALTAIIATLWCARGYFDARALHLGWANAARLTAPAGSGLPELPEITWSAPLDDTFIHFDFAEAFARMKPFEWSDGGGYSSGATSWLYPAALAIGILFGFVGQRLGEFADLLACGSVIAYLWFSRHLTGTRPRLSHFLLVPALLTSGVLGWSLFSGMELALFLAIWAVCASYYARLRHPAPQDSPQRLRYGLGGAGLLLVMTRPEALFCVGIFAWLSASSASMLPRRQRLSHWFVVLAPALAFTVLRAGLNRLLTGSFADAGALVKLETLHPFHDSREVALRWLGHIGFQFARITTYHTTDDPYFGWVFWVLAVMGFIPQKTRRHTALLWIMALGWIVIVGQNEYVRYQNDRYTMPALAWLLTACAIGVGGLVEMLICRLKQADRRALRVTAIAGIAGLSTVFLVHQIPRVYQQRWLFGRACRNIAEQQVRVGQLLRAEHFGKPHRVLLGDAGAIPFFSKLPALDAIGLGGTHHLPFARAVRLGVGATVELIEHLKPEDRPDLMAIYPSWWDLLPVWFGEFIAETTIRGNVICGAPNKAVYRANWRGLDDSPLPLHLPVDTQIVDELDFADVLSESDHHYALSHRHAGYVLMRLLPHPVHPRRDVFDAGRLAFWDTRTRFTLSGFEPGRPIALVFRAAPTSRSQFRVKIDGSELGRIEMQPGPGWQEPVLDVPGNSVRRHLHIEIIAEGTEYTLYHLWAVAPR